jgi:hypothetical protein
MNWNIFKRFRAIESTNLTHALTISVLTNRLDELEGKSARNQLIAMTEIGFLKARVDALEKAAKPAIAKAAVEKLVKAQAYRREYYQKRKAAMDKFAELKRTTK